MLQKIRLFLSTHLENHSLKPELDFFSFFFKMILPPPPPTAPSTPVLSGALKLCTETTCRQQLPLPLLTRFKFPVIHYLMVFSSSIHSSMHTSPSIFFLKNSNKPTSCPFQFPPLPRANLQDYRGELEKTLE